MSEARRSFRRAKRPLEWLCSTCLLVLVSCSSSDSGPPGENPLVGTDSLDLANTTYLGIEEADGPVAFAGGRWEGVPFDSGGASRPTARLMRTLAPEGDLDGDGTAESVALVTASAGGTGNQLYAAVIARRDGRWRNVATVRVGDRVGVRDARIEPGRLVMDVVQAGPDDPRCCPGELATRSWELRGDSLAEFPVKVTGRLLPSVLEGGEWVLRAWSLEEDAASEPEVTLRAADGGWAGTSGCNRYTVGVVAGESPGDVKLGPIAGTRMACPDPAGAIEARFLGALGSVSRIQFLGGRLALRYEAGAESGLLLFEHRRTD
jgi:heat shock protein HslJ